MTVILMSPVEGLQPGEEYTGPNEDFLLQEGYAKPTTKRRKDPAFLDKPKAIEYEHDDEALYPNLHEDSVANRPTQRVLPVDPHTAVQTGHPADPLTDTDENLMPTQEDVLPKGEVTGSTTVVGPLEGTQTPSDDTLAAADSIVDAVNVEDGPGADPDEESGAAPAVAEDELANPTPVTVNEHPVNYADPEPVEGESNVDDADVVVPAGAAEETAADADGISSEEDRTLDEQPETPAADDGDDVFPDDGDIADAPRPD